MLQRKRDWDTSIHESSQMCVPLKQVKVEATVRSFAADVTITQIFRNDETSPIEAVYCFPIEEHAAIYSFIARIDDREIVAQLKEKKQAQREYNHALRENHGAYMLEQNEESQDNFIINVGALQSNQECHITISYVNELNLIEDGTHIQFVVPTTIAPRYNPNQGGISSPAGTTTEYVQIAPYTIQFYCRIEKTGVSSIRSFTHPMKINLDQENFYIIEFAQDNTHLDRDIIVDAKLDKNWSNTIVAVESSAIMASFIPTIKDCQLLMNNGHITNEFIFIIDCSGSMDEANKIGLARQAMLLFLKSLPIGCQFNIIRFGNTYQSLFKDITDVYNDEKARQAEQLINNMKADLGGTELLPSLKWLNEHPPNEGYSRQIFLLSDGEISNVDQVLNLCRSMSVSTRIFSFGLGSAPSRALIKGLARATNGRFVFIPPGTSVDVYVGEQLQKALQPCFNNVTIKLTPGSLLTHIVPTNSPPVFINDRLIVYAILNSDKSTSFDHNVTVELYSNQHQLCVAKIDRIPNVSDDGMITRLAAKALISELQHSKQPNIEQSQSVKNNSQQQSSSNDETNVTQKAIKDRIIEISLKYNILCPYTAFIGIEKRVNSSNADMKLREVPIQISADNPYLRYLEEARSRIHEEQIRRREMYDEQVRELRMCHSSRNYSRNEIKYLNSRNYNILREAQNRYDEYRSRRSDCQERIRSIQHQYVCKKDELKRAELHHEKTCELLNRYEKEEICLTESQEVDLNKVQQLKQEKVIAEKNLEEAHQSVMDCNEQICVADRQLRRAHECLSHCQNELADAERQFDKMQVLMNEHIHMESFGCLRYDMERLCMDDDDYQRLSTEMDYIDTLQRYEHEKKSSRKPSTVTIRNDNQADLDIVRQLIDKQKFDGLWEIDTKIIEQLTGKSLSDFPQIENMEILVSAIIVAVLETRFASISAMWYGIVQKARQRIIDILDNDQQKFETLLDDIRKRL